MLILKNMYLYMKQMGLLMVFYGQGLLNSCIPTDPLCLLIYLPASMLKVEMLVSFQENTN